MLQKRNISLARSFYLPRVFPDLHWPEDQYHTSRGGQALKLVEGEQTISTAFRDSWFILSKCRGSKLVSDLIPPLG